MPGEYKFLFFNIQQKENINLHTEQFVLYTTSAKQSLEMEFWYLHLRPVAARYHTIRNNFFMCLLWKNFLHSLILKTTDL